MLQPKTIARFAVVSMVVYAGLTWLWPRCETAYARFFRGFGNVAFSQFWFWSDGQVNFIDQRSDTLLADVNAVLPGSLPRGFRFGRPLPKQDTLLVIKNHRKPGNIAFFKTGSRLMGYAPTAVILSLVLATPVSIRRRVWMLFWSLLLIHAFIVVRLTFLLLNSDFANPAKKHALFHPSEWVVGLIGRLDVVLNDNPTFHYLVPVFFWLLILIGMEMWSSFRKPSAKAPGHSGGTAG